MKKEVPVRRLVQLVGRRSLVVGERLHGDPVPRRGSGSGEVLDLLALELEVLVVELDQLHLFRVADVAVLHEVGDLLDGLGNGSVELLDREHGDRITLALVLLGHRSSLKHTVTDAGIGLLI